MGKSSSQVVGYRYYAKFAVFIGNRIEKLLSINFDKRGWIKKKTWFPYYTIDKPDLYGENEGGVAGVIYERTGLPDGEVDPIYQAYQPLASGYPYQSYLIFSGLKGIMPVEESPELQEEIRPYHNSGFYLGNSGYMKEMLLWVKRTRVRNDGRAQWYEVRGDGAIVCEIGAYRINPTLPDPTRVTKMDLVSKYTPYGQGGILPPETQVLNDMIVNGFGEDSIHGLGFWKVGSPGFLGGYRDPSDKNIYHQTKFTWKTGGTVVFDYVFVVGHITAEVLFNTNAEIIGYSMEESGILKTYKYKLMVSGDGSIELNLGLSVYLPAASSSSEQSLYYTDSKSYVLINKVPGSADFDAFDINPIHKVHEILTDDTAMSKPESDVNDANFIKAADRIYNEGLGISWAIDEKSCIEAIEELCYHIEAGIRVNRQTGLYEMVLFRDDWFSEDEIHDIAENKIKDLSLEVMNSDDIVNQLNITYYDRERIKNSTFSIYENGSILTMGHANAESIEFPYFMNMRNAEIVANWKLKQFSTPAWSGSFTTGWREARKWNRYDLIRLPWSKKWNGTILVRIMKINLGNGTDNTITIDFEEVIPYSREMNTSIVVDAPVETAPQSPQPSMNAVFEAPYYLTVLRAGQTNADLELSNNPDIGYVAAIAAKPQNNSLNALLYTDGGAGEFEQVSRLDYCDILQLDQPIIETTSSFTVTGSLTQIANSNNLILLNDELIGFVSFDNEMKILTVKRGVLDTIPKKHSSGSLFIFDLPDVAFDSTQYAQSEIVGAQVLTTTPSGIQDLLATGTLVEIHARAIRPYPPANVKINDVYYPETIIVTNDIVLTWGDRNRLQQTGGMPLGFFDGGVTVENGVTYSYELTSDGVVLDSASSITINTATIAASTLKPNKPHTLKLWSVRDGYESYQEFEHSFFVEAVSLILTATATSNDVSGNTVVDANITVIVDELLKANVKFDGASITGKTMPGATVTIEVDD